VTDVAPVYSDRAEPSDLPEGIEAEARFRALFTHAAVAMGICDITGQIIEVNQAMADMLGFTLEELRQRNVFSFAHPDDAPDTWTSFAMIARGERNHSRREKYFLRKDGSVVRTDMTTSLLRDALGRPQHMVSIMQDITEQHLLHAQLAHQARHDPLTGLPNRRLIFERMEELFADPDSGRRIGLCYIDLDGFKMVNDTLGHDVGDRLLVSVADRLREPVSRRGHLFGRMGGDEFIAIVADSSGTDELVTMADLLIDALHAPFPIEDNELTVSASVGIVERPIADTSIAELIKAADTTLRWAKSAGKRRRMLFDADRHASEIARYTIAATMPAALRRGEFSVEYQPLVRLSDRGVCGVEALVRWQHPQFGRLLPSRFIEVAEEIGLIGPLGLWVLSEACRQVSAWPSLFVSVNLAAQQIRDPTVVETTARILHDTGLDPARLHVELTESALMTDASENLAALAAMGVRVAIDDFGTGYSNLAYLCNLPVHTLKLAASFVESLGGTAVPHPDKVRVVATLIRLAHGLGLSATAEGVETSEQAERLLELGCDHAQGWLFGGAVLPSKVTERLGAQVAPLN